MADRIQEGVSGMKTLYYNRAEGYEGWKDKTRSQLCIDYVNFREANDPRAEYCFAAIVYKFWNLVTHNYYAQQIRIASEEDCLTWVIDAIMFVLDQHVWTDPTHKLYNDPNAPEKCINVVIMNNKINFFVAQGRQKRKINTWTQSIDSLVENGTADAHIPYIETEYNYLRDSLITFITKCFEDKDYLCAFILDILLNFPDTIKDPLPDGSWEINMKSLQKMLSNMNATYIKKFSERYGIKEEVVENAVMMLYYVSSGISLTDIDKAITQLRKHPQIIEMNSER